MRGMTINLWFNDEAEAAARFYAGIFPNSTVNGTAYYPYAGSEVTCKAAGEAMSVPFSLDGQRFIGLNGGPTGWKFNESISLVVDAETQADIDRYWEALTADGGQESQCGWLKDKYGVSWQIVPPVLGELFSSSDPEAAKRLMGAMLQMKKLDIATLEAAAGGADA